MLDPNDGWLLLECFIAPAEPFSHKWRRVFSKKIRMIGCETAKRRLEVPLTLEELRLF